MAWQSFSIDQYEVSPVAFGTPGYTGVSAFIRLRWGGQHRATLWFHRGGTTLIPPNASFSAGGSTRYYAHFTDAELHDAVDLLRNEKPVFFNWNDTTTGAFLATAVERVGETEGPAPPGTAEALNDWLLSHPAAAGSIKWQTVFQTSAYDVPETTKLAWPQWTQPMKDDLGAAFAQAWSWLHQQPDPYHNLNEALPDPPVNIAPGVGNDNGAPYVEVSETHAWNLYVRWIAWCLVVELGAWVPWSVTAYTAEQRQVLFDSAAIMSRNGLGVQGLGSGNPDHPNYVKRKDNLGASLIAPPRYTAAFMELNGLRGTTRLQTIGNLLQWARDNLIHFYGAQNYGNMETHWQYRGLPPISRIIEGTTHTGLGQFGHWTAGCHGTTGFLRNVLRAVNIPVQIVRVCGHSLAYFMTEGRYLDHGDNPYNLDFKATGLPASALLIDEATYAQWFGPNPDNHDDPAACPFIGHQVQVLHGP
ncbi:MAG: hypothetical protein A3F70_07905 [Acidobacteria bacterium RIFCSPLOWO2_12_FULL_67_14]|nr:MAG: hypothetical protein A3F70_07905 [Acidobacteria bacterium RIFCSPLOWO2_12_FULL_67_14]